MQRTRLAWAAAGACALALSACGSSKHTSKSTNAAASTGTVTLAISQPIGQLLLPFLAQSRGDFTRAGVHVVVKFVPSAELLPAIASGSVQLAVSSAPQLDLTALKAPVKLIGQWAPHADIQFVAAPGVTGVADLRGKTISASSPGSASYVLTRKLLKQGGLSASDVHQAVLASASLLAPAFKHGTIDGSTVGPPLTAQFLSLRPGAKVLANFSKLSFTGSELAAYMPWARAHRAAVKDIITALDRALAQWRSDPAAAEAVLAQQTGANAAAAKATYRSTLGVFLSRVAPVSLAEERSVLGIVSSVYQPSATPSRAGQVITSAYVH